MLTALQNVFGTLITMIGSVISALVGTASAEGGGVAGAWGDLLQLFVFGIAVSVVLLSVKVIRKVVWGS